MQLPRCCGQLLRARAVLVSYMPLANFLSSIFWAPGSRIKGRREVNIVTVILCDSFRRFLTREESLRTRVSKEY